MFRLRQEATPDAIRKRSGIAPWRSGTGILFSFLFITLLLTTPTQAAPDITTGSTLAYIKTTNPETDRISQEGLNTLARLLQQRTSMDQVTVAGVDPTTDELAFYPLIYWPIIPEAAPLTPNAAQNINGYLHHGGMILFDTLTGEPVSPERLQRALAGIEIPPLEKLPTNHVLKRSFYLLDSFPGRYADPDFWLEPETLSSYDGVASVLLGSNGWAAAWATNANGQPQYPCSPNGEAQRERAYRFGINLVMYALTGNYKSDQLHAQALLQKLGKE